MTTKDHQLIAEVVRQLPQPFRSFTYGRFARRLGDDNPRFNSILFAKACGVKTALDKDNRERISDYTMAEAQQDRDEQYVGLGDIDAD